MARPFKWNAGNIKEMTDAEIDYISHQILTAFVANDTGPGVLTTTSSGNTSIGTFTDTYRTEAIGAHPATGATGSDATTVYQNRQVTGISITRPLEWTGSALKEMTDATILSNVIADCIQSYTTVATGDGLGQYYLGTSAPAGDTWTAKITINDQYGGSSGASSTNYYIWRKTAVAAPTVVRPFKWNAGNIKEMTDGEMQTIIDTFREYIRTSGIGQYALQASAPVTGTWVARGSITDTRQQNTAVSYAGNYDGAYTRQYLGPNTYIGNYAGNYLNENAINYAGNYLNENAIGYAGDYLNENAIGYVRTFTGFQTIGPYDGPSYAGPSTYIGNYSGPNTYIGDYAGPNTYIGDYAGNYLNENALGYDTAYTGQYIGDYTGLTISGSTENVTTLTLWMRTA